MIMGLTGATVGTGWLARANPAVKLAVSFLLAIGVSLTDDPLTPALVLAGSLLAVRAGGVPVRLLLARGWPLLVSAAGVGLTTLLLTDNDDPWLTALAVAVRVLAIALPGFAVLMTIDPTDLADSLVQNARIPARFAYASLAALRLLPLMAAEWRTIRMARRGPWRRRGAKPAGPRPAVRRHRVHLAGRRGASRNPAGHGDGRPRVRLDRAADRRAPAGRQPVRPRAARRRIAAVRRGRGGQRRPGGVPSGLGVDRPSRGDLVMG